MKIEHIDPSTIVVGERKRALREDAVGPLMESIKRIGIRVPIAVRFMDDVADSDGVISMGVPVLVAGRHRLEAAKRLGLETVPVVEFCDETDARLWEIAENLHRCELTEAEKRQHLAEWVKLTEHKLNHGGAVSPNPGGRGNEGGVRAAARELGVSQTTARRAVAAESLPDAIKAQADELGLGTVKRAELAAASPEEQEAKLADLRAAKAARLLAAEEAKEARKAAAVTDAAIRLTDAQEFAAWIERHCAVSEINQIITWLQGTKAKDVIAALRRAAA